MTTDLERIETELGFRFGDPDHEADAVRPPTTALLCRNPECTMNGTHVAVHHDTIQPITCGGLTTDPTGTQHPCGTVLLCDHQPLTTEHTEGTLGAPVKITTTRCSKCGTTLTTTRENLPPIPLTDLPIGILDTLTGETTTGAAGSTA